MISDDCACNCSDWLVWVWRLLYIYVALGMLTLPFRIRDWWRNRK